MGPPPDPEQMIGLMQNPQFASTLNEALQNPQLIDMMIQQNPMLRGMGPQVRQMMQTPEFRRMMTDPEQLRQMARMHRLNPGMMPGMGGGADGTFPAPGITDVAETGQDATPRDPTQPIPPPFNPMAGFGGPAGTNPFAALLNNPAALGFIPPPPPGQTTAPGQPTAPNPFASPPQITPDMMQMLQLLQQQNREQQSNNPGSTEAAPNPFAALLAGMGNAGFGQPGGAPNVPQDTRAPEDRYAEQLRQLNDMGFFEFERNIEALRRTGGSVQGAVEYLLTH